MADPKDQKTQLGPPIDIAKGTPGPAIDKPTPGQGRDRGGMGSALPPPPAPPPRNPQLAGQSTIMLDAQSPQMPAPQPAPAPRPFVPRPLPPPRRETPWGRWVAGPVISVIAACFTLMVLHYALPGPKPPEKKKMGRLRLMSDPTAAAITVDGAPYPHFTPTVLEEQVGKRVRLRFTHENYQPKEEDLLITENEITYRAKLEKLEKAPDPVPVPPPDPEPVAKKDKPKKKDKPQPEKIVVVPEAGRGKLSVYVRPWAIVYVDGTRVRQTPVIGYDIQAGKHTVELVNEERNRREKIVIQIGDGQSQELRRDWDKD